MKKISVVLLLMSLTCFGATNVLQYELKANEAIFKKGFEAGLKALEFQRKNDGYAPKRININKEFYLTYDIRKMPYTDAIFLQNIASREGFNTHITEELLFFGEFEREADAKEAQKELKDRFDIDVDIKTKKGDDFLVTYPKLWGDFYTHIINKVKQEGIFIQVETIEKRGSIGSSTKKTSTKKSATTQNKQTAPMKFFTLKNSKAMGYSVESSKRKDSKAYKEVGLQANKNYRLSTDIGYVITEQGEKYYKVYNQNLYFSDRDVILK